MPKSSPKATVNPISLQWKHGNLPISPVYDDSYYSAPHNGNDGRMESQAVFLAGNDLPLRWQNTLYFCIAELGFGTGLNFLETVQQWLKTAPVGATLSYTSFELHPLSSQQIHQALTPWPDLQQLGVELLCHAPKIREELSQAGWSHKKYIFPNKKTLSLTLAVGDANTLLPNWGTEHDNKVDAWYLDGFSPAKNPQLWNQDLMHAVFNATAINGTFSTYTSAGHVRRALSEAGFEVQKVDGFGKKRHRLQGLKL